MVLPTFPTATADYINGLTDEDFENGGHRTNFIPSAQGTGELAAYTKDAAEEVQTLAEEVAEIAEAAAAGSGTEASVADIREGGNAEYISSRNANAAGASVVLTDASTISWDMATGITFKVTLGAAGRTLANPTNKREGKSGVLRVFQDGTGGRTIASWGSDYIWIGGEPAWPVTPGARSMISYFCAEGGQVELTFAGSSAV